MLHLNQPIHKLLGFDVAVLVFMSFNEHGQNVGGQVSLHSLGLVVLPEETIKKTDEILLLFLLVASLNVY